MLNQKHFSRDAQGFVLTNKEILSVGLFSVLSRKKSTTTRSCSTCKRLEKERKTKDLQSAAGGLMSRSSRSPLAVSHFACCVDTDGLYTKQDQHTLRG